MTWPVAGFVTSPKRPLLDAAGCPLIHSGTRVAVGIATTEVDMDPRCLRYYIRAMKSLAAAALAVAVSAIAQTPAVDAAFQKFWDAKSPAEALKQIDAVLKSGVTYDDALRRLKQGRTYGSQKTGVVMSTNRTDGKVD